MFTGVRQRLNDRNLLNREQLNFVDEVNGVLEEEILFNPRANLRQDREVLPQVAVIEENLNAIINNLRVGGAARERYVNAYPRFKRNRDSTITKLYDISRDINSDRHNCNVAKLPGYLTSFSGGAVTLLSISAAPLLVPGVILTGLGCALTVGTGVTETVLLKADIEKAQELIEEDQRAFRELGNWLGSAAEMQRALIEILDMSPSRDVSDAIRDLVNRAAGMQNNEERRNVIRTTIQTLIANFAIQAVVDVPLLQVATIISVLVIIFQLLKDTKHRIVFDGALVTFRGIATLGILFDDVFDIASLIQALSKDKTIARTAAKAFARGALSVLGMTLDFAGILSTIGDMKKGSISPEARKIGKYAADLREEADKLERVYNSLR